MESEKKYFDDKLSGCEKILEFLKRDSSIQGIMTVKQYCSIGSGMKQNSRIQVRSRRKLPAEIEKELKAILPSLYASYPSEHLVTNKQGKKVRVITTTISHDCLKRYYQENAAGFLRSVEMFSDVIKGLQSCLEQPQQIKKGTKRGIPFDTFLFHLLSIYQQYSGKQATIPYDYNGTMQGDFYNFVTDCLKCIKTCYTQLKKSEPFYMPSKNGIRRAIERLITSIKQAEKGDNA